MISVPVKHARVPSWPARHGHDLQARYQPVENDLPEIFTACLIVSYRGRRVWH